MNDAPLVFSRLLFWWSSYLLARLFRKSRGPCSHIEHADGGIVLAVRSISMMISKTTSRIILFLLMLGYSGASSGKGVVWGNFFGTLSFCSGADVPRGCFFGILGSTMHSGEDPCEETCALLPFIMTIFGYSCGECPTDALAFDLTSAPSVAPSNSASGDPTAAASDSPSMAWLQSPSLAPTDSSFKDRSVAPTSLVPSLRPSTTASENPTRGAGPQELPFVESSAMPTIAPSVAPIRYQSALPSIAPTSAEPSYSPSLGPTTSYPSEFPSAEPSKKPSIQPFTLSSVSPSELPSDSPSGLPTTQPSVRPSKGPSLFPSVAPTGSPSSSPSLGPTTASSDGPSYAPTLSPTDAPTPSPTEAPVPPPTDSPSSPPTVVPVTPPTEEPVPLPTDAPVLPPTVAPVPEFVLGKLTEQNKDGLRLSQGLTARIIARSGEFVNLTSTTAVATATSPLPFHSSPDGAAVFELSRDRFIYVSNSEERYHLGGVYGLEFDSQGQTRDYKTLLFASTRNCNGGKTPWNTWISCEETTGGQCYQIDPYRVQRAEETVIGGTEGGFFEAFVYDDRIPSQPTFFVTEDRWNGALRRFRPNENETMGWDMLHRNGTIDYLEITSNSTFRWTSSLSVGRQSASNYFRNCEGITHHDGILMFVSKVQYELFRLDLDKGTYSVESTKTNSIEGGGSFGNGPDHLLASSDGLLYFSEDGGPNPGVYVYDGAQYKTLLEANSVLYENDETTGIAFSPDRRFIFFCFQEAGVLFQVSRIDGLPFEGRRILNWKYDLGRR